MIKGHCLCGAVQFAYNGTPIDTAHCYCESCRRATSSPVTTFVTVLREDCEFSGDPMGVFASSQGVERYFCRTCGSPMGFAEVSRPDQIDLYAASLADPTNVKPDHHAFDAERLSWIELADTLPRHAKGSDA